MKAFLFSAAIASVALVSVTYVVANRSTSQSIDALGPVSEPPVEANPISTQEASAPSFAKEQGEDRFRLPEQLEEPAVESGTNGNGENDSAPPANQEGPLLGRIRELNKLKAQFKMLQGDLLSQKFVNGDYIVVDELSPSMLSDSKGRPLPNAVQFRDDGLRVAVLTHDEYPLLCELNWSISDLKKEIRSLKLSE